MASALEKAHRNVVGCASAGWLAKTRSGVDYQFKKSGEACMISRRHLLASVPVGLVAYLAGASLYDPLKAQPRPQYQPATNAPSAGEWRTYGGDLSSNRYAALDQINKDNFSKLEVA